MNKTWSSICRPNIHGWETEINGVHVEIIRYYHGDWRVNGGEQSYINPSAAAKAARLKYAKPNG